MTLANVAHASHLSGCPSTAPARQLAAMDGADAKGRASIKVREAPMERSIRRGKWAAAASLTLALIAADSSWAQVPPAAGRPIVQVAQNQGAPGRVARNLAP